jgi:hypothetical protein
MVTKGDTVLLFSRPFPFDFETDLPLRVGPGVYLAETPWDILQRAGERSPRSYVLPDYSVPGLRRSCACLHAPVNEALPAGLNRRDLVFNAVCALRLDAPIGFEIAGGFDLGDELTLLENATLYNLVTAWQPEEPARYTAKNLVEVAALADACLTVGDGPCERLATALVLYGHTTCGFSQSLHLSYLGLFAALESLYWPKGNLAESLAERASEFLASFAPRNAVFDWLKNEYATGRNRLAHGAAALSPWPMAPSTRAQGIGKLHEITRLSILGFLSLPEAEVLRLHSRRGDLGTLGSASGRFLDGQRMWLGNDRW